MNDRKMPVILDDAVLDEVIGGARIPRHTPEFRDLRVGDPGITVRSSRFIGETEKNVWKAPAGTGFD